jgi:hypothetical protein
VGVGVGAWVCAWVRVSELVLAGINQCFNYRVTCVLVYRLKKV